MLRSSVGPHVDGELRGRRLLRVQRHLEACARCRQAAKFIVQTKTSLQRRRHDAPAGLHARASAVVGAATTTDTTTDTTRE